MSLKEVDKNNTCHAQIGIGVCTLGSRCVYKEGHEGPHSYSKARGCSHMAYICNKHKDCRTKE